MPPLHTEQSDASRASLPATVRDALAQGRTIEAIKILREAWGIGFAEAQAVVDAYVQGDALPDVVREEFASKALPGEVIQAMQAGNKIEAIRLLREHIPGLGLKDAKDRVEACKEGTSRALQGGRHMRAPGEVPRGSFGVVWLVALALGLAVAAYYWLEM